LHRLRGGRYLCGAAPEGRIPLDSHSPLRRGIGTAIIAAAPCPARQNDGGQGG